MANKGYLIMHREELDDPIYGLQKPFSKHDAWTWLNANARHTETPELPIGSLRVSYGKLADTFGWTKRQSQEFINRLIKHGELVFLATSTSIADLSILQLTRYISRQSNGKNNGLQSNANGTVFGTVDGTVDGTVNPAPELDCSGGDGTVSGTVGGTVVILPSIKGNNVKTIIKQKTIVDFALSISETIEYLNIKIGTHFSPTSKETVKVMQALLIDPELHATVDTLKAIINNQVSKWYGTEMQHNLNPQTLFRKSHYDTYLNALLPSEPRNKASPEKPKKTDEEEMAEIHRLMGEIEEESKMCKRG